MRFTAQSVPWSWIFRINVNKRDFYSKVVGFGSSCTQTSVQDVAPVQDQDEDVSFSRLETLMGRTILQVRGEKPFNGKFKWQ